MTEAQQEIASRRMEQVVGAQIKVLDCAQRGGRAGLVGSGGHVADVRHRDINLHLQRSELFGKCRGLGLVGLELAVDLVVLLDRRLKCVPSLVDLCLDLG